MTEEVKKPGALTRVFRFGRKTLPLLSGFLAPELIPVVQAALSRIPGMDAGGPSPEQIQHHVADQLRQTAEMQDQRQAELRTRLQEQAAVSARLEAELATMRRLLERATGERDALAEGLKRLDSMVRYVALASAAAVALGITALAFALFGHR